MNEVIQSAAELDALPAQSLVGHDEGWGYTPAQKATCDGHWYVPGSREYITPEALLPATVLFRPDAEPAHTDAEIRSEERKRILGGLLRLPVTRTQAWDKGWYSVSITDAISVVRDEQ